MLKRLILPIFLTTLFGVMVSCNSKTEDDEVAILESSSVAVTSFSLNNDKKVLDSLSNVFFSIDLVGARIFNADSLPYGTKVSRLVPSITVASGASAVTLKYFCPEVGRDSLVNYLESSTDSIDFSAGPVTLTVVSQNGDVKRDYQIKVNVHKSQPDSLAWYSIESAPLPSSFNKITDQCTAELNGVYYCLSTDGTSYCLATTRDPAVPQWRTEELTLPFAARVNSLRTSASAIYMLSKEGELFTSTDFKTWTSTGQTWHYIYGGYAHEVIGCVLSADGNKICSYPSGETWDMPAEFPIDGTSVPALYTLSMSYYPQMVLIGGRRADDTLSSSAWGFDGFNWAEVSVLNLPNALQDITLVPYHLVEVPNTTWAPYDYPVLLAFGGRNRQGAINRDVYYSRDWGMTWHKAPDLMQLPDEMPTFYGASAFVYSSLMHVSRASGWSSLKLRAMPPQFSFMGAAGASRAIAPITQWECPAIYLFGGRDYDGNTLNTVWRGVILQFTFKPVQ